MEKNEWVKSSWCDSSSCVEVALLDDVVGYRDSKDTSLPPVIVTVLAHMTLMAALRAGELTGPEA